jgi:hypothetical protein
VWYSEELVKISRQIDRIGKPSTDAFERYVASRTPVIISGALDDQKAASAWTCEYLKDRVGEGQCEVYVSKGTAGGHGSDAAQYNFAKMALGECIERMSTPGKAAPLFWPNERYYLYRVPPRLFDPVLDDLAVPAFASCVRSIEESNLYISQHGHLTPPHMDFAAGLVTQVRGRKKVLLWDPSQWSNLYLNAFGQTHARQSPVDVSKPDIARFPLFLRASALEGVLETGDALFIPFGYIHCFYSDTFSMLVEYAWGSRYLERTRNTLASRGMLSYCTNTPWITSKLLVNGVVNRLVYGKRVMHDNDPPSILDCAVWLGGGVRRARA